MIPSCSEDQSKLVSPTLLHKDTKIYPKLSSSEFSLATFFQLSYHQFTAKRLITTQITRPPFPSAFAVKPDNFHRGVVLEDFKSLKGLTR